MIDVAHHDTGQKAKTPFAVFSVAPGKRYRFRMISNAILNCPFQISIDNHTLVIIASDGGALEAYAATSFVIYGGERFDFVVHAKQTPGECRLVGHRSDAG